MVMLARLPEGKLQQLQHALSVGMVGGTDTAIGSLPKNNWFRQQNRWRTEMVNDGEWWSATFAIKNLTPVTAFSWYFIGAQWLLLRSSCHKMCPTINILLDRQIRYISPHHCPPLAGGVCYNYCTTLVSVLALYQLKRNVGTPS